MAQNRGVALDHECGRHQNGSGLCQGPGRTIPIPESPALMEEEEEEALAGGKVKLFSPWTLNLRGGFFVGLVLTQEKAQS